MSSLKSIEKRFLEDLFQMGSGYVLDFTNTTFADFFNETVNANIYDEQYSVRGNSKASRLRLFWDIEPDATVAKVLSGLLEVIAYNDSKQGKTTEDPRYEKCRSIIARLSGTTIADTVSESAFLKKTFGSIYLNRLPLDPSIIPILESRMKEAELSRQAGASLAVIFMCGSILEGVLLGVALSQPKKFNQSASSPKDKEGKVKSFQDWTLCQFIDVASDVGMIGLDVKKFSHSLRDFRNYIHPYEQLASRFEPSRHTSEICYQVMKACLAYLGGDAGK